MEFRVHMLPSRKVSVSSIMQPLARKEKHTKNTIGTLNVITFWRTWKTTTNFVAEGSRKQLMNLEINAYLTSDVKSKLCTRFLYIPHHSYTFLSNAFSRIC